jgi:hypothetical protein
MKREKIKPEHTPISEIHITTNPDCIGPKSDLLTTIQSFLRTNLGHLY